MTGLVKWGLLHPCGITVSPTGLVSANGPGIAIVTATLGKLTTYGLVIAWH